MVQQCVLWPASNATNMHMKITMYLSNQKFELKFSNYNITILYKVFVKKLELSH